MKKLNISHIRLFCKLFGKFYFSSILVIMKYLYLLPLILAVFVSCNSYPEKEMKAAKLSIGTGIDTNDLVTGTPTFNYNDTFAYSLYCPQTFKSSQILQRISRIKGESRQILVSNYGDVSPDADYLFYYKPVSGLYDTYGKGQYEMSFILKDSVLASCLFTLQ